MVGIFLDQFSQPELHSAFTSETTKQHICKISMLCFPYCRVSDIPAHKTADHILQFIYLFVYLYSMLYK